MKKVSLPPTSCAAKSSRKCHWGTSDEEVINFLDAEHSLSGDEAVALLAAAHAARRKEIRKKAIVVLLFSGSGLAISVTYFAIQFFVGFVRIGPGIFLMLALAIGSALAVVRSLAQLATGSTPRSAA
jgi:hypothetical protein